MNLERLWSGSYGIEEEFCPLVVTVKADIGSRAERGVSSVRVCDPGVT